MITPINEVLEEFIGDMAEACGERWDYQFYQDMMGPSHGLYIDICESSVTIHGRLDSDETIFTATYQRTQDEDMVNWEIFLAGLIYFYRLIGLHMGKKEHLAAFSVSMTEKVVKEMSSSANEGKVITLSFKEDKAWIDTHKII